MPYQVKLIRTDEFALPQPDISLWCKRQWMEALAELHQIDVNYLICEEAGNIVAYMPIYSKHRLGMKRAYSPVMAYYNPIHFILPNSSRQNRNLLRKHEISTAIAVFLKKAFLKLSINLSPENYDVRGFTWSGFKAVPLYTFIQDLQAKAQLFPEQQRKLNIALKQDFSFDESFDPEPFIKLLYELYEYKEHDFKLSPKRLLDFLTKQHDIGLIRQYNIRSEKNIASADILLCDETDTTFAILRATTEAARKNGISVLQNVSDARELNTKYKFLDFCGANISGPARFKAAFGYDLKVFFRIQN